jgi:hypothetical protein
MTSAGEYKPPGTMLEADMSDLITEEGLKESKAEIGYDHHEASKNVIMVPVLLISSTRYNC